jgi:hypothetical protein
MDAFFANLYELFGLTYLGDFSNDMYSEGFYIPIGMVMFASIIVIGILYYYVINHPRWNRWFWWLSIGLILAIVNSIVAWIMADSMLVKFYEQAEMIMPYGMAEFLPFCVMAGCLTLFFYFVFSFIIKWWSRNCKHSPFL